MFYIVETLGQIRELESYMEEPCFLQVIPNNFNYHPKMSFPVAIYIRPLREVKGFILPINHEDGLNLKIEEVSPILNKFKYIFVLDKKNTLYHLDIKSCNDLSLLHSLTTHNQLEISDRIPLIEHYYIKFNKFRDINRIIPIPKLYERSEKIFEQVKSIMEIPIPKFYKFYNNLATEVFLNIESKGIKVDTNILLKNYSIENPDINISNSIIYTQYNLNNITGRPTNSFNHVNFAAIPKESDHRRGFLPEFDYFIEFDFDGYHLRLLSELIGYEVKAPSIHTFLAKKYFNKEQITEEEYKEAKQINFQAIYGKIPDKYKDYEIFVKLKQYTHRLWEKFNKEGYIEDPISTRRFYNSLPNMNPPKLLNYLIQSLETSRNITILKRIQDVLVETRTKVVLYTYDAVLLDYSKEDGTDILRKIKNILEEDGKFPVKFKYSNTLFL